MILHLPHALLSRPEAPARPWLENGCASESTDWVVGLERLAARWRGRKEEKIALAIEHAGWFLGAMLAAWHAGKQVVIPANFQPGTLAGLRKIGIHVVGDQDCVDMEMAGTPTSLPKLDPDACLLELFTSGSTGEPKRIVKTLGQLEAEVLAQETMWGEKMGEAVVLATVPHHHIYGLLFRLLWPVAAGRRFEARQLHLPEDLMAGVERHAQVALVSSPAHLQRLPDTVDLTVMQGRLGVCFSSGGPLSMEGAQRFLAGAGVAPLEIFGSTETGGVAWRSQGGGDAAWTPLASVRCWRSEEGALTVTSPFLADTQPYVTDDGVALLADGRFLLKGRLDRVVKLEEKRLSLTEQECRLSGHPWVSACALLVLQRQRQTLCAAVVLSAAGRREFEQAGALELGRELRRYLATWYEGVVLPRRWRFPEALPLNERGKLCRLALQSLFEA